MANASISCVIFKNSRELKMFSVKVCDFLCQVNSRELIPQDTLRYVLFHCVFLFLLGESCMEMWDLMQVLGAFFGCQCCDAFDSFGY